MGVILLTVFSAVHIVEWNRVFVDADISDQVAHLTVCGLIDVGQNTVVHVWLIDLVLVSANLLVESVSEDVLVAEHVLNLALINGHFLRVSVLHGGLLVTVGILNCVVLLFTHLGKLLLQGAVDLGVKELAMFTF